MLDGRHGFSMHFKKNKILKLVESEERRDVKGGKSYSSVPPGALSVAHGNIKIPSQLPAVIE